MGKNSILNNLDKNLGKKEVERKDVFGILNEFAKTHGIIDVNGSYGNAGEVIHQSDSVQTSLTDLVCDLYDALQLGFEDRLEAVVESIKEVDNFQDAVQDEDYITVGFDDIEIAYIVNDIKDGLI